MNVFCRHPTDGSTLIGSSLYDGCWTSKILQVIKIKEVITTLNVAYFFYRIIIICQHNGLMHLSFVCSSLKILSWLKSDIDSWWGMYSISLLKQTSWNTVWVPESAVGMLTDSETMRKRKRLFTNGCECKRVILSLRNF